jgi:hypothetical protein
MTERRLPLWLKAGWTVWVALWIPLYWKQYGPSTFLWFCDFANLMILAALWTESSLLFSWQAVSVLVVQIAYTLDVAGRALFRRHFIGGTEWMFQENILLRIRLASLFMHVAAPPVLIWGIRRLGYDRRALICQIATTCVLLPISWWGFDAELNLNWVWRPFGKAQAWVSPGFYLVICMVGYTLLFFLPTHLVLNRLFGRKKPDNPPVSSP